MEFIESKKFVRFADENLTEEEQGRLQAVLLLRPELGNVIPGAEGLRKLRWASEGKGKRSGFRIIYYWYVNHEIIFLLNGYKKSHQDNISREELRFLIKLVKEDHI